MMRLACAAQLLLCLAFGCVGCNTPAAKRCEAVIVESMVTAGADLSVKKTESEIKAEHVEFRIHVVKDEANPYFTIMAKSKVEDIVVEEFGSGMGLKFMDGTHVHFDLILAERKYTITADKFTQLESIGLGGSFKGELVEVGFSVRFAGDKERTGVIAEKIDEVFQKTSLYVQIGEMWTKIDRDGTRTELPFLK